MKLSIVIPVFNRAEILKKTLSSIAVQPGNWECILVDDHSTENVANICQNFIDSDSRFKYVLNTRTKGAPGARNTGIEVASGDYIFLFDSDNLMHENALLKIEKEIEKTNCDILVFYGRVLNEQYERINHFRWICSGRIQNDLINGLTYVDNNLSVIKKDSLLKIGLTDELAPSYQEWDTHIRLSESCNYHTFEEELIDYIKWEKDTISSNLERSIDGLLYVIEKHVALFKRQKDSLLSFCMQIEDLSKKIEDPVQSQKVMDRINALMPSYASKSRFQRFRNNYHVLIELVKRKLSFK